MFSNKKISLISFSRNILHRLQRFQNLGYVIYCGVFYTVVEPQKCYKCISYRKCHKNYKCCTENVL